MATSPLTFLSQSCLNAPSQKIFTALNSTLIFKSNDWDVVCCSAKKKIGFFDQFLDYIEGGPKLRTWYGTPDLLPKDGSASEDDDEFSEDNEVRDAILVANGDSKIRRMIILSLIVKRDRVKALVKDRKTAMEAFGYYVESLSGDANSEQFMKKALRGVRAIICPNEGFLSNIESLKGVNHVILLSQLSAHKGSNGIQALVNSNAQKLSKQDQATLMGSGIPYTIIRVGALQNTPDGTQGFSFEKGSAEKGNLSKEDVAAICVQAVDVVPQAGFFFEVVNGEEKVSD